MRIFLIVCKVVLVLISFVCMLMFIGSFFYGDITDIFKWLFLVALGIYTTILYLEEY